MRCPSKECGFRGSMSEFEEDGEEAKVELAG